MGRLVTILAVVIAAVAAGGLLPVKNLQIGAQPLIVFLSIMAAAVLVRLNRGMPSIDWRVVPPQDRKKLTQELFEISKEYAAVLAAQFATLLLLLGLTIAGPSRTWPDAVSTAAAFLVGLIAGFVAFSVVRMGYVVWRDIDIVGLQKTILDKAADEDAVAEQVKIAREKVESIGRARLPR